MYHNKDGPRHLTVTELADRCRVSTQTVYGWNRAGVGPRRLRIGRHVRYRLADVEAWEASQEQGGHTAA